MDGDGIVSTLAGQWARATARMGEVRAKGLEVTAIQGIVRSLRLSLAHVLFGRDLREVGREAFTLRVDALGWPQVRHGSRSLPVSGSYVRHLFEEAGLELVPREILLLDAGLVRDVVEEALSRTAFYEAGLREEKSALRAAYLAACPEGVIPQGEEHRPRTDGPPEEGSMVAA
jgi:hypothetical protein